MITKILKVTGIVFGVLIGIIILYLIVVIFAPGFNVNKQPLPISESATEAKNDKPPESRKDVSFKVEGLSVSGWLYLPKDLSTPVPCIIMSHGFGATKDMVLESYALRFQESGLAVLIYDYRYFGKSKGEPRQLFAIPYQLKDLKAAIEYARGRKEIDSDRIALWGTSAGGGYGLVIAAEDKKIACIVGQCPALDGHADFKLALEREGIGFFLRLFMHAQRDKGRSRFGLSAHKIPIVGKPGTFAIVTAPGAFDGYSKLASPSFKNEACARALLMSHGKFQIEYAKDMQCPVLQQICEKDNLVSISSTIETIKRLGEYAEVTRYPIRHFDIYSGEHFEESVSDQIEFFKKHL